MLLLHYHYYTIVIPSLLYYHYYTITTISSLLYYHYYTITITTIPSLLYHHYYTITITTIPSLLYYHYYTITITTIPSLLYHHHHYYTTTTTLSLLYYHYYTLKTHQFRVKHPGLLQLLCHTPSIPHQPGYGINCTTRVRTNHISEWHTYTTTTVLSYLLYYYILSPLLYYTISSLLDIFSLSHPSITTPQARTHAQTSGVPPDMNSGEHKHPVYCRIWIWGA